MFCNLIRSCFRPQCIVHGVYNAAGPHGKENQNKIFLLQKRCVFRASFLEKVLLFDAIGDIESLHDNEIHFSLDKDILSKMSFDRYVWREDKTEVREVARGEIER